jgi:hypothetical protein
MEHDFGPDTKPSSGSAPVTADRRVQSREILSKFQALHPIVSAHLRRQVLALPMTLKWEQASEN